MYSVYPNSLPNPLPRRDNDQASFSTSQHKYGRHSSNFAPLLSAYDEQRAGRTALFLVKRALSGWESDSTPNASAPTSSLCGARRPHGHPKNPGPDWLWQSLFFSSERSEFSPAPPNITTISSMYSYLRRTIALSLRRQPPSESDRRLCPRPSTNRARIIWLAFLFLI